MPSSRQAAVEEVRTLPDSRRSDDIAALLDARPDPAFDDLTALAAEITGAPVSLLTLVADDRQVALSTHGLPEALVGLREIPRSHCLCLPIARTGAPRVVADARTDGALSTNGAVSEWGLAAYVGVPVRDSDGTVLGVLSVAAGEPRPWSARDLTNLERLARQAGTKLARRLEVAARERAERALEANAVHFQALIEHTGELIALLDGSGVIRYASPAFKHVLGYGPEEAAGLQSLDLVHPDDLAHVGAALARVLAEPGAVGGAEYRTRRADGGWRTLATTARNLLHVPAVGGVVLNARDVTQSRDAQAALVASEARLRLAVSHSSDAVLVLDEEATFRFVSPVMERLLGHAPSALVGRPASTVIHPADWPAASGAIARAFAEPGTTHIAEVRVCDAAGAWRPCEAVGRTAPPEAGLPGLIVNLRDMTAWRAAEAARRGQEARFRALIEHAHDVIGVLALDGTILYESPAIERVLGYRAEAVVGRTAAEIVHPDDVERVAATLAGLAGSPGASATLAYRCRHADGSWRTLEADAWNLTHEPAVGGVVVNARDVTERAAAEAALRESEARYADVAANVPGVVYQWEYRADGTGGYTFVSEGARTLLGVAPEDALRDPAALLGLIHPDERPAFVALAREVAATLAPFRWEGRVACATGEELIVRIAAQARRQPDGTVVSDGLILDVTEAIRASERLRESEARLAEAQRVGRIGSWSLDVPTQEVWWSAELFRLFGRAPDRGPLSSAALFAAMHPDDRARVRRELDAHLAAGSAYELEYRVPHPDGSVRVLRERGEPRADDAGRLRQVVGTMQDVTERVGLEEQLRQAQKMEAVGQLAGGIAHDFNNLLLVIGGNARFARESLPPGAPAREDLAAVEEASDRAAQLTRQLLAFSRKQMLRAELLDLNRVVRGIEPMLVRLIGEDVTVRAALAPELPAVLADPGQLEQVLVNLAVNARDAMPDGGRLDIETAVVELTPEDAARRGGDAPPGAYVRLTVRDTGVGMDAATLAHAFEPFFTTKGPGKGTGLGLATVYGVVRQSGGYVRVASEPGRGTTFEVDLPQAAGHATAAEPAEPAAEASTDVPAAAATVLLVEDETGVRDVARRILTRAGYRVLEAPNGREALRAVDRWPGMVDLVLTDLVMPEMSGRALAERLTARHPGVRVLFMSGYTDDEILRRGLAVGGPALVQKPFDADRLLGAVRQTLAGDGG